MRPWFPKKLQRLDELAALEPGWLDGAGERPTADSIDAAKRLLAVIAMLTEVDPTLQVQIVPTADGGVSFEWRENGWDASIEIGPQGKPWVWAYQAAGGVQFSYPEDEE